MDMMFFIHENDLAGLNALLRRMHSWGQLNYYDMAKILENLEEPNQPVVWVFPVPGFDYKMLGEMLQMFGSNGAHPLTNPLDFSILVRHEQVRKMFTFGDFLTELIQYGKPNGFN